MSHHLTVLIACKNERFDIRPCIESVQPIADEILVADSGSTDGTLDIVNDVGCCRVIEREYVNAADFRNWAIPQAQHEWVLIVDADERVTEELTAEIRHILSNPSSDIDGYWVDRDNHYLGHPIRHCGWSPDDVLRLFRRDVGRYQAGGTWHEEVDIPKERTRRLRNALLHYTTWSTNQYTEKLNHYANLGARNYQKKGRKPRALTLFLSAPVRFLQLYFLRLGFLDGLPGFHVCMYASFYSFLKKAKLWEMHCAHQQPDPEARRNQSGREASNSGKICSSEIEDALPQDLNRRCA